jgi:rod shape-determining protein MreC
MGIVTLRTSLLGILILAAVLVLLNLPERLAEPVRLFVRDNFAHFQRLGDRVGSAGRSVSALVRRPAEAAERERALQKEVADLRRQVWQARIVEEENKQLRALAGAAPRDAGRLILCEVINRGDTTGIWQTLRLDRGRAHGVEPQQAVMSARGLVGRTVRVSETTSEVLLITDPTARVACRVSRSDVRGILEGTGVSVLGRPGLRIYVAPQPATLDYLPADAQIARGEEVYTSGWGGIFPEGLLVGYVKSVSLDRSRLYQVAEIVPSADLLSLRFVFVIARGEEGR